MTSNPMSITMLLHTTCWTCRGHHKSILQDNIGKKGLTYPQHRWYYVFVEWLLIGLNWVNEPSSSNKLNPPKRESQHVILPKIYM